MSKKRKKNKDKKKDKAKKQETQPVPHASRPKPKVKVKSKAKPRPKPKPKEQNVIIREMTLEDLSAVYALGERLFTVDWPTLYRTWDEYEIVEMFASDGESCLVADQKGRVVGFVLGTLIEKRHSAWSYGYLLWLGVAPELRGIGLGERLVNRITEQFIAMGARMMLVDTSIENQPAINLFQKLGFGDETQHIYFFRNLTTHPDYLHRKEERQKRPARNSKSSKILTAAAPPPEIPAP